MSPRQLWLVLALSAALPACNPYNRTGEFYAGPIDARQFPAAYRGSGAEQNSTAGTFSPSRAWVNDVGVGYFVFPVPARVNPLRLHFNIGNPKTERDQPLAYVFDPDATSPFPAQKRCKAPENYVFDSRRDFVRFDEQGSIFTALPTATIDPAGGGETFTSVPVVAEVKVTTNGAPCQDPKSGENIVQRPDVSLETEPPKIPLPDAKPTGKRDGKYLAWAVIDPSADVRFFDEAFISLGGGLDPVTALGPQKWGWFDHFLLAYIDGGYIPTTQVMIPGMMGAPAQLEVHAIEQMLFVPTSIPDPEDPTVAIPNPGIDAGTYLGSIWDVAHARRGEAEYSPICHVLFFDPPDPLTPVTNEAAIPASAMLPDEGVRIYCLQYQQ